MQLSLMDRVLFTVAAVLAVVALVGVLIHDGSRCVCVSCGRSSREQPTGAGPAGGWR